MKRKFPSFRQFLPLVSCFSLIACGGGGGGGGGGSGSPSTGAPTGGSSSLPPTSYKVGGKVAGVAGTGLTLQNNGGDDVSISGDGPFVFAKALVSGSSYSVKIASQPASPAQNCTLSGGDGVVGTTDVENISVTCSTQITFSNYLDVAKSGHTLLEVLPQIAEFIGLKLTFLSQHLAATATEVCKDPNYGADGHADYVFTDVDQSGSLSVGDTVEIDSTHCYAISLGNYVDTKVKLTIGSAPQPATYEFGTSASVTLDSLPVIGYRATGQLDVAYTDIYSKRTLVGRVDKGTLSVQDDPQMQSMHPITVTSADVAKTLDYVTAMYQVSSATTFRDEQLKSQFSMTTPQSLTGYFGVFPAHGMTEFRGGTSTLRYVAQDIPANQDAVVSFDADGSGVFAPLQAVFWNTDFRGYAWYESRWWRPTSAWPAYYTTDQQFQSVYMIGAQPWEDPINQIIGTNLSARTPIRLFFTRPLDATRNTFTFDSDVPNQIAGDVPAVVSIEGAIATITPARPLEHGEGYYLRADNDGVYAVGVDHMGMYNTQTLKLTNNLQADGVASPAVAAPGQTVALTSARSSSTDAAISGAKWKQLSGTPVQLLNADSRSASFVVPAGATDGEKLVFELTITDANGETDTVPVTAYVLSDLTQPFVYFRTAQGSRVGVAPEDPDLESPLLGSVTTQAFDNGFKFVVSNPSTQHSFLMSFQSYPEVLATGTFVLDDNTRIFVDGSNTLSCNQPEGKVVIRDIALGPSDEVIRFAADWEQACPGGFPPQMGSVRVNSAVPLP